MASTSKSFTGFGVALLAQRGDVRFDAPITELLPGVRWHERARADTLTLAHFLAHTHGLNDNAVVASAAFAGGLATTLVLYRISTRHGRTSVATMLLAGIAIGALAMSLTGILIFMADDRQLRDLTFWQLGSLAGATWQKVGMIAPIIVVEPNVVNFSRVPAGEPSRVTITVQGKMPEFELGDVTLADDRYFTAEVGERREIVVDEQAYTSCEIHVSYDGRAPIGRHGTLLTVRTSDPRKPVFNVQVMMQSLDYARLYLEVSERYQPLRQFIHCIEQFLA